MSTGVVIASAARTPIGSYGKALKDVPPTTLGALAARTAVERAGIAPTDVEHVVIGSVIHTEPKDMYMARVVGMEAGIPKEAPAFTVNRLCGSGVQAIISATQAIQAGDVRTAVAGGAESMSRGVFFAPGVRFGERMGDGALLDATVGALTDPFDTVHMGITAENIAEREGITREDQDRFAVASHHKAAAAREAGRFVEQIVPVTLNGRKGETTFDSDEHLRADASVEGMGKLRPAFKKDGGTVTAGNASGVNDAGAAVTLLHEDRAAELGVEPVARIVGYATSGVDPKVMGMGPVPAIRLVLDRTGVALDDVGVIELNEAFAAQSLGVTRTLGLADDDPRVNPNGGAIALGHPIGASGAIITTKALAEMAREGHRYGLVSLCIGGGQGIALLLERP